MASVVSRTSRSRTYGPSPGSVGRNAPSDIARLTSDQAGFTGYGQVRITPEAEQAMADQGMQTGGPFSPGRPLQQFAPPGMDPRAWDFMTGYNIATRPRAQTGRASFDTLKGFIEAWDVARLCINHIQRDIRSMDWSIVPKTGLEEDVADQVQQATQIMSFPAGDSKPFDAWQWTFLEDVLRYDAGTLFRRRTRAGKVGALEVVSGTTIAPEIDYWGREPQGDAPAYVQYISGVPWQWLRSDALIYQPFAPQPESVYGLPVAEWLMLTGNTDIRFQWHFLLFFTEGTVPEGFMEAPPDMSDPENIIKFQNAWDAFMEGDQSQKHRIRWVPAGSKPSFPTVKNFDEKFPLYLTRKVCGAFGITPNDIGITDAVNKASSETQVDVQFRIGTMPLIRHLQGIYTRYLQIDRGLPVEFQFDTGREKEDRLDEARAWDFYVRMGAASPDEPREKVLGLPVDVENPTPRFVVDRTGLVPLLQIQSDSGKIDPATVAPLPERVQQVHAEGDVVSRAKDMADLAAQAPQPIGGGAQPPGPAPKPGAEKPPAPPAGSTANGTPVQKASAIVAAGLLVKSRHSGRVLMIQRGHHDTGAPSDPSRDLAAGKWEFPGGRLEPGEEPLEAAKREWTEEVGCPVPAGQLAASWTAPSGIYQGFVWLVEHEHDVPINLDPDRRGVFNPDDPDGDKVEVVAWWDPRELPNLPSLRDECFYADWPAILAAGNGEPSPPVQAGKPGRGALRKARRREVAAAGLPFVKAAESPLASRPLHEPISRAEDHYADQIRRALLAALDVDRAASWRGGQITKSVGSDLYDAALAFLRGLGLRLDGLRAALKALYEDGWQLGRGSGEQAAQDAGFDIPEPTGTIDWSSWTPGNAAAAEQAAGLVDLLRQADAVIRGIDDGTMERLARALSDGAASGDSVDAIARGLRDVLGDFSRAEAIVNTELNRAVSAGSLDTYRLNGIPGKGWLVFNPCPICAKNDGVVVRLNEPFPSGDQMPPAHPHCRCSLTPERLEAT